MAAERQCCVPLSCLSPDGPASTLTRQMTLDVAVTHADCAPRPYPRVLSQVQGSHDELASDQTRGMSPGNTPLRTPEEAISQLLLRQLLVRAGALRFKNDSGEEMWGPQGSHP
jgi:hypothetical protein